jgi:hypothetical protein
VTTNAGARDASDVVAFLVEVGADPNAFDKRGAAPLHRVVQNTAAAAQVQERRRTNRAGSSRRSSPAVPDPTDTDANGKAALDAASSDWVRVLLARH